MRIINRYPGLMQRVNVYCQFRCAHCGIYFEMEDEEDTIWETSSYFQCDCPECKNICKSYKNNLNQGVLKG